MPESSRSPPDHQPPDLIGTGTIEPDQVPEIVLEWLDAVRPSLKPKTVRSYESLIGSRLVPALGGYPIAALSPMDVQRWINDMETDGLSASRISQAHVVLSQILKAAVLEGRLGRNVALERGRAGG